ncbi:hypothetical protein NDU88_000838 [Pleurodeles waltl]|uniref:Uncharacterized protein n=1 Tax=Pleurodeles waltl TaxID=8319 RepID=A0AAV7WGM6_PLEWA|nr:hypothetical protein NDU88_000838 [Pleurodeles waltl]
MLRGLERMQAYEADCKAWAEEGYPRALSPSGWPWCGAARMKLADGAERRPRWTQAGRLALSVTEQLGCGPAGYGEDTSYPLVDGEMGRHRQTAVSQGNTVEQYTTPAPLPQCQARMGGPRDDVGNASCCGGTV